MLDGKKRAARVQRTSENEDLVSDLGPRSGRAALVELAFAQFTEPMTAPLADKSKHARPLSTFAAFQHGHFIRLFGL
jgi:hypothetical protein